jgi:uncharacterized membrane protein YphA (DoxX/SURF4 family)
MEKTQDQLVTSVWRTFRWIFAVVPLVAGLDKFTNLLVYWPKYLAPQLAHVLPVSAQAFMHVVGIVEIVAGLAVMVSPWPRQFGYVVAAWLTGIALDLVMARYFDVAVRDLVMAVSAFSFARLGAAVPALGREGRHLEAASQAAR